MIAEKSFSNTLYKNNKGFTLVEAVVAIAMVGIVSVGITSLMFSLSRTSRMSGEQLKQNAVFRVIKENVLDSARKNADIIGNSGIKISGTETDHEDLLVFDRSGGGYPEYRFDVFHCDSGSYGDTGNTVDRYKIAVKRSTGEYIADFYIEVYPKTGG